jgi:hypothetical protein
MAQESFTAFDLHSLNKILARCSHLCIWSSHQASSLKIHMPFFLDVYLQQTASSSSGNGKNYRELIRSRPLAIHSTNPLNKLFSNLPPFLRSNPRGSVRSSASLARQVPHHLPDRSATPSRSLVPISDSANPLGTRLMVMAIGYPCLG